MCRMKNQLALGHVLALIVSNVYLYLMPVITVIASVLILKEPVTILTLAAIVLILAGLILSQRKEKQGI